MKKKLFYSGITICFLLLWGCQRENDVYQIPHSNLRNIMKLVLNPYQNEGNVTMTFTGTVDETNKIIKLKLPKNLKLDSIRPQITFAPYATISPNSLDYVDLSQDTVWYTVTAESGKKAVYGVVKDPVQYIFTNPWVYAINLTNILDDTGTPLRGKFSGYSLTMNVPTGTDVTKVMTDIEFQGDSQNATVIVKENGSTTGRPYANPVDFTKTVIFSVISEDGSKTANYNLTLKVL